MIAPSIILVRPQMGENIGAAARAMANFNLSNLRLVAPRDGWPNPKASDTAGHALTLIDDATIYPTAPEAVADCQFILATTARTRALNLPVLDVREAMQEAARVTKSGGKTGILFGPERTGLENEDTLLANAVVTIPVSERYPSLNIAQAVVVTCYEWHMIHREDRPSIAPHLPLYATAPHSMLNGLFGQLEAALDAVNFWRVPEKKAMMWQNLRVSLLRAGFTEQEIATWRGVIRALTKR